MAFYSIRGKCKYTSIANILKSTSEEKGVCVNVLPVQ